MPHRISRHHHYYRNPTSFDDNELTRKPVGQLGHSPIPNFVTLYLKFKHLFKFRSRSSPIGMSEEPNPPSRRPPDNRAHLVHLCLKPTTDCKREHELGNLSNLTARSLPII